MLMNVGNVFGAVGGDFGMRAVSALSRGFIRRACVDGDGGDDDDVITFGPESVRCLRTMGIRGCYCETPRSDCSRKPAPFAASMNVVTRSSGTPSSTTMSSAAFGSLAAHAPPPF